MNSSMITFLLDLSQEIRHMFQTRSGFIHYKDSNMLSTLFAVLLDIMRR